MKASKIIQFIENKYPLHLQEEWDHSGIQLGNINKDVNSIMIALDCDLRTINEAIENNCDMLITHHPLLFKTINLNYESYMGKCIYQAIKNDIVIYSTHTPIDKVSMNKWLAESLSLKNITQDHDYVSKGELDLSFDEFITHVKKSLNVDILKVSGYKKDIHTVCICGGSGSEFINDITCDAYITGDIKYHSGENNNCVLIDAGHHIEVIMIKKLKDELKDLDIKIIESESPDYFRYL